MSRGQKEIYQEGSFHFYFSTKCTFLNYLWRKFRIGRPVRHVPLQGVGLQRGGEGGPAVHGHPRRRPQSL